MSAIITFEPIKNINRVRERFKPTPDGYYRISIGALGTYNSAGAWYEATPDVIALFNDSSILQRRIQTGTLYAEAGHPKIQPGMTIKDYMRRLLEINEKNHIAHIRKIELINRGGGKYEIMAEIKPLDNDLGRGLKSKLENPHANVAFSIRSFTRDKVVNGILRKTIKQIMTFDYVTEPGIVTANKWDTVGTESISVDLEETDVKGILEELLEEVNILGNESSRAVIEESISCIDGICEYTQVDREYNVVNEW